MKKRFTLFITLFLLACGVQAQVFNTGHTLRQGTFSIGIEPTLHSGGGANGIVMFFHGGYGLKKGLDMGFHVGFTNPRYIGGDLEFALSRNVSLAIGAHQYNYFGLDGTLNVAIPLRNDVTLYSGLDSDLLFTGPKDSPISQMHMPLWVPVGVEIYLNRSMYLLLEAEIAVNETYHVFGGGVCFYL